MPAITRERRPTRRLAQRIRRYWRHSRAHVHRVSYPKCGRAGLALLIDKSLQLHYGPNNRNPLMLHALTRPWRGTPYILRHHNGAPGFLFSEELKTYNSAHRSRKVIFMVRNPHNVRVSSCFQKTRRSLNRDMPEDFLLARHEDLHSDPVSELRRVLHFSGLGHIPNSIAEEALDSGRFDNMYSDYIDNPATRS